MIGVASGKCLGGHHFKQSEEQGMVTTLVVVGWAGLAYVSCPASACLFSTHNSAYLMDSIQLSTNGHTPSG